MYKSWGSRDSNFPFKRAVLPSESGSELDGEKKHYPELKAEEFKT